MNDNLNNQQVQQINQIINELEQSKEPKTKSNKKKLILIIVVLIVAGIVVAFLFLNRFKPNKSIEKLKFYVPESWKYDVSDERHTYIALKEKCGVAIMYMEDNDYYETMLGYIEDDYGEPSEKRINGNVWNYKKVSDDEFESIYRIDHGSGVYLILTLAEENKTCTKYFKRFEKSLKFD